MRRGLGACQAEWKLLCGTHNLLKLWRGPHRTHPLSSTDSTIPAPSTLGVPARAVRALRHKLPLLGQRPGAPAGLALPLPGARHIGVGRVVRVPGWAARRANPRALEPSLGFS
jgi:hypothetical protein